MNVEVIDNFFQVAMLGLASIASIIFAIRYQKRQFIFLAFAYGCFMFGTLFYVLHLAVLGDIPRISYISEILWLASYLFYLALQLLRMKNTKIQFSLFAALYAFLLAEETLRWHIFGPSLLSSLVFAFLISAIAYLSFFHMHQKEAFFLFDLCMLLCVSLQIALYIVSAFMMDFTHFNLYFAVDLTLTSLFVLLLPLAILEVRQK